MKNCERKEEEEKRGEGKRLALGEHIEWSIAFYYRLTELPERHDTRYRPRKSREKVDAEFRTERRSAL